MFRIGYSLSQSVASIISPIYREKDLNKYYYNVNAPTPILCKCPNRNICKVKDNRCMDIEVIYMVTITTNTKIYQYMEHNSIYKKTNCKP